MRWFYGSRHLETRLNELHGRLEGLAAVISRLETEWLDTKDQVRKSYQRLEAAARRAEPSPPPPPIDQGAIDAARANLDPFSRKLLEVRSMTNADAPGTDESAG